MFGFVVSVRSFGYIIGRLIDEMSDFILMVIDVLETFPLILIFHDEYSASINITYNEYFDLI